MRSVPEFYQPLLIRELGLFVCPELVRAADVSPRQLLADENNAPTHVGGYR